MFQDSMQISIQKFGFLFEHLEWTENRVRFCARFSQLSCMVRTQRVQEKIKIIFKKRKEKEIWI